MIVIELSHGAGPVTFELLDLRQVSRVHEQQPGGCPDQRGSDYEQREENATEDPLAGKFVLFFQLEFHGQRTQDNKGCGRAGNPRRIDWNVSTIAAGRRRRRSMAVPDREIAKKHGTKYRSLCDRP